MSLNFAPDSEAEGLSTVQLRITGMTCEHCVRRVDRALRGLKGVRDVFVDRAAGMARISFERTLVDSATLQAAVVKSGYQAALTTP
jgi:copper chaperone CopZ